MVMSKVSLVLVGGVAMAVLLGAPASVSAKSKGTKQQFTVPVETDITIPCTGDVIHMAGEVEITTETKETPSGGFFLLFMQEARFSGVSDSGAPYRLHGKFSEVRHDMPAGSTSVISFKEKIKGKGHAPDVTTVSRTRTTVDENGEVTVDMEKMRFECD